MASVLGLLSQLPIFLLLVTSAVADDYRVFCDDTQNDGVDTYTVTILIKDLAEKVPGDPRQAYCNVLTSVWSGRQIHGYANCATDGRIDDPVSACNGCLKAAGEALVDQCRFNTGSAGQVWGPTSLCYIKIGNLNNCPFKVL